MNKEQLIIDNAFSLIVGKIGENEKYKNTSWEKFFYNYG